MEDKFNALWETNLMVWATFYVLSVNASSLDKAKILSFGKRVKNDLVFGIFWPFLTLFQLHRGS